MNRLIRETDQVIKLNLRQLAVFEVLFRLVAGTFYIRLANQLLRFSLRMAGYSYLTMSNMGAFLWRPLTIVCVAAIIAVGMVTDHLFLYIGYLPDCGYDSFPGGCDGPSCEGLHQESQAQRI